MSAVAILQTSCYAYHVACVLEVWDYTQATHHAACKLIMQSGIWDKIKDLPLKCFLSSVLACASSVLAFPI
jgi:hypothetical protein